MNNSRLNRIRKFDSYCRKGSDIVLPFREIKVLENRISGNGEKEKRRRRGRGKGVKGEGKGERESERGVDKAINSKVLKERMKGSCLSRFSRPVLLSFSPAIHSLLKPYTSAPPTYPPLLSLKSSFESRRFVALLDSLRI